MTKPTQTIGRHPSFTVQPLKSDVHQVNAPLTVSPFITLTVSQSLFLIYYSFSADVTPGITLYTQKKINSNADLSNYAATTTLLCNSKFSGILPNIYKALFLGI
jgi:hypothetical protein